MKKSFTSVLFLFNNERYDRILGIIRSTTFLLLQFICFSFSANANSQDAMVNLNKQNATLKEVLEETESQTDYLFASSREVQMDRKVSIRIENERTWVAQAGQQQQQQRITGVVKDEGGKPIVGATISEKGTENSVMTDLIFRSLMGGSMVVSRFTA